MIKIAGNQARAFAEKVMDDAEAHGFEQIGMVGFDAHEWYGITGTLDDLLMILARSQALGSRTAMIFLEHTNNALDAVLYVERMPYHDEWAADIATEPSDL